MKRKKNLSSMRDRKIFPILIFLLVLLMLGSLLSFRKSGGLFWTEWYPLLIPASELNESLISDLNNRSGGEILFEGNTLYNYNGFNEMLSITPEELESGRKLLSHDPRLDPFLRGSQKYFSQDIYSILYLPAKGSPLQCRYALRDIWNTSWIFPDASQDYLLLIIALILSLLLIIQSGRSFLPSLLLLIYTGSAYYLGGHNILLPGIISLFLLSLSCRPGYLRVFFFVLLPFPMVLSLMNGLVNPVDCAAVMVIFLSASFMDISPLKLKFRKESGRISGRDHDLFIPVSLVSSTAWDGVSSQKKQRADLIPLLVQAVLLILVFTLFWTENRSLPVSVPRAIAMENVDWSWDGIRRLESSGDIPGVREMLMHRAYQEALPYGGTWSLPVEGDSVTLPIYKIEDGVVHSSLKVVQTYDQEWLTDFFNGMSQEGPGMLLRSEAGIPSVTMAIDTPGAPSAKGVIIMGIFIILGIILSLMSAAGFSGGNSEDYRMMNNLLIRRRKQQAA